MPIRRIAQMGHPVLRQIAEPIDPSAILTPEFKALLADLRDTMADYDGAGLAAPQIHVSKRVVICTFSTGPEVLINPVLTPIGPEMARSYEGCLSVAGLRAAVDRAATIRLQALGETGAGIDRVLTDFDAIVAQHECDHLDGVLYVDRCDTRTLAFVDMLRKHGPLDPDFSPEDVADGEGEGDWEE